VFLLDALATYAATEPRDAEAVVERVTPRLQHANAAVVLSAVKVVVQQLPALPEAQRATLLKKMAPPLVSLLSGESEIQYVALRNILLLTQQLPGLLAADIKVFFCKYNDPIYVKLEKLEVLIALVSDRNIELVRGAFSNSARCPQHATHSQRIQWRVDES
jgi:AP-1 complex subunit beta-1